MDPPKPGTGPAAFQANCDDWERRAAYNRAQFAAGNKNHSGMPMGMRRDRPRSYAVGGGRGAPQHQAPRPPPAALGKPLAAHYATLGVPLGAKLDEVKRAYKKLALKYHPDKNLGDMQEQAERQFRNVQEAYDKLSEHLK